MDDLENVYREQYRPLVGFIRKRLDDPARAEELAQEVFVRAINAQPDNPRAWLYTVAANLVRDEGRRRQVRNRHLRLVRDEAADTAAPPSEALERRQRQERIREALAALTERDRKVLLLKQEGMSYAEIAEQAGLSTGAVGTTLSRARARLAAAWEKMSHRGDRDDVAH